MSASWTTNCHLQVIEDLVKKYKTVGGLLRKIEEVVTGTNNGKAPQLAGYYAYWERSIFSALNSMVLNAMRMLVTMLHARSAKKAAAAGLPARPPLFKVTTALVCDWAAASAHDGHSPWRSLSLRSVCLLLQ